MIEYRQTPVSVGVGDDSSDPVITLQVVTFGIVDEYGTEWMPGVFDEFLQRDRPTFYYGHNGAAWLSNVLGHGGEYRMTASGYVIDFHLDDFEAVPSAKQAYAQARSKTLRWASVGFERKEWTSIEDDDRPGLREQMIKADLPEVSLLSTPGAVEGAGVVGIRSPVSTLSVPTSLVSSLAADVAARRMTRLAALQEVRTRAASVDPSGHSRPRATLRSTSAEGMVDAQIVGDLAVQLAAGEIDLLGALEKIREAAGGGTLTLSTPKPKGPDKPAEPTTEPTKDEPAPVVSDAAAEATEQLLQAVTAEAQAAKATADTAAQAEAEALILAADAMLDGLGRSHRGPETRSAVGYRKAMPAHDTSVVDKPWDGPAATAAMPNDAATLKHCHAWQDTSASADPAAKGSYKIPHHLTKGGPAIVDGVRNGLSRLPQTKGIPAGDLAGVEKHLQAHLDKFNAD